MCVCVCVTVPNIPTLYSTVEFHTVLFSLDLLRAFAKCANYTNPDIGITISRHVHPASPIV